jgi:hypothetical protein
VTTNDNASDDLSANESRVSDFRLPQVLAQRRDIEGGYAALARAITRSWRGDPARELESAREEESGPGKISDKSDDKRDEKGDEKGDDKINHKGNDKDVIDRRKLTRLIEGDDGFVLSLSDLRALDCYLDRYGEGLAFRPLFEKPDIMRTLAKSGHVTFLLGSSLEEDGGSFSYWDVLAMAELQRSITAASEASVQLDIHDVPLYPKREDPKSSTKEEWRELFDEHGPSLVVVASSRTIPAAEGMQCAMFGRREFEDGPLETKLELPIHFVWNPHLSYVYPSHFHLKAKDIEKSNPQAANEIDSGEASAIAVGEKVYLDKVRSRKWGDTYGVCFAQRRPQGQVWLLLAGVTGAATFAAARVAKRLGPSLREADPAEVHCFVIRAHVEPDQPESLAALRDSTVDVVHETVWRGPAG